MKKMGEKKFKIKLKKTEKYLCREAKEASSFGERLLGLMFEEKIPKGDCLVINPCQSIHTFFMKFNLDVIFIDSKYTIIKIIRNFRPWRLSLFYYKSKMVLEMNGGTLPKEIKAGDELEFECIN